MTFDSQTRNLNDLALHWLQEQLCVLPNVATRSIRDLPADYPLAELPGKPDMRELYAALRKRGVELPPLFLSRTQHVVIVCLAVGVSVLTAVNVLPFSPPSSETALEIALPGLLTWAVLVLFAKLCLANVSCADTIAELAGQILAKNPMFFRSLSGLKLTREQIQEIVINIVVDACGVDREEVTLDTPLVKLTD